MKRDTVKTLAGLLVIAVIVVATFMYGNAQRQSQLKHDQAVKQQQDAKAAAAARKAQPTASGQPTSGQQAANTAPVQSPASNSIQGSNAQSSPSKTPAPAASSGQVAGAQTTPTAGGTDGDGSDPLPQTGPAEQMAGVIGLASIVVMWLWLRRSKRAVFSAVRSSR